MARKPVSIACEGEATWGKAAAMEPGTMKCMVAFTESSSNESYVEPSPNAWFRSRAPIPTSYALACDPLYPFQEILKNRTSRARGMTSNCAEVSELKFLICNEIWQVELESCVWRVSFHKYAYVHGDPIQGIDPSGEITLMQGILGVLAVALGLGLRAGYVADHNAAQLNGFREKNFSFQAKSLPFAFGTVEIRYGGNRVIESPDSYVGTRLPVQIGFTSNQHVGGRIRFLQVARVLKGTQDLFIPVTTPFPIESRSDALQGNRQMWRLNGITNPQGWFVDMFPRENSPFYQVGAIQNNQFPMNRNTVYMDDEPGVDGELNPGIGLGIHFGGKETRMEFLTLAVEEMGNKIRFLGGVSWGLETKQDSYSQTTLFGSGFASDVSVLQVIGPRRLDVVPVEVSEAVRRFNPAFKQNWSFQ